MKELRMKALRMKASNVNFLGLTKIRVGSQQSPRHHIPPKITYVLGTMVGFGSLEFLWQDFLKMFNIGVTFSF